MLAKLGLNAHGRRVRAELPHVLARTAASDGVPIHVLLRLVLERCADRRARRARCSAGARRRRPRASRSPAAAGELFAARAVAGGARLVGPDDDGWLVHTNHFLRPPRRRRRPDAARRTPGTLERRARFAGGCAAASRRAGRARRSTARLVEPVCRHGDPHGDAVGRAAGDAARARGPSPGAARCASPPGPPCADGVRGAVTAECVRRDHRRRGRRGRAAGRRARLRAAALQPLGARVRRAARAPAGPRRARRVRRARHVLRARASPRCGTRTRSARSASAGTSSAITATRTGVRTTLSAARAARRRSSTGSAALAASRRAPRGYRAPGWELTPVTLGLLAEHGFALRLEPDGRRPALRSRRVGLVELPVHWSLDDAPYFAHGTGRAGLLDVWRARARARARPRSAALTLTLHPEILGRPHRADVLRRVLELAHRLELRPVDARGAGRRPSPRHQTPRRRNAQPTGEPDHRQQLRVAPAALEARDLGRVHLGGIGQALLREAGGEPQTAQVLRELGRRVHRRACSALGRPQHQGQNLKSLLIEAVSSSAHRTRRACARSCASSFASRCLWCVRTVEVARCRRRRDLRRAEAIGDQARAPPARAGSAAGARRVPPRISPATTSWASSQNAVPPLATRRTAARRASGVTRREMTPAAPSPISVPRLRPGCGVEEDDARRQAVRASPRRARGRRRGRRARGRRGRRRGACRRIAAARCGRPRPRRRAAARGPGGSRGRARRGTAAGRRRGPRRSRARTLSAAAGRVRCAAPLTGEPASTAPCAATASDC